VGGSETLMRYSDNGFSAAIGYKGDYTLVILGFPLETVISSEEREGIMNSVIRYMEIDPN
jgi:hypothetical protein